MWVTEESNGQKLDDTEMKNKESVHADCRWKFSEIKILFGATWDALRCDENYKIKIKNMCF